MGITKHTQEIKLRVSAKRLFKALVTESHIISLPNAIKNVEILHGDGGAGTIRQTNLVNGSYLKHRIEALDIDNRVSKYTLIEGPLLGDKLESIYYEQEFEDSSDGGCIAKIVSEYHTKGDIQLKEEDIKAMNDKVVPFYTLTEDYLLANPDVCV
ncbi:hypothetical protein DH2020_043502 [Rehmannia glutinosa]|uniref:Bet v I/Major latex protein domain-containing protein n=1 Tax=Rehmannia glutinosa TaxID=99300 RepID=A0ABR0UJG8_REHGL